MLYNPFEPVTKDLFNKLGYTILRSVNAVDDESPTWIPEKVEDIFGYILKMECFTCNK